MKRIVIIPLLLVLAGSALFIAAAEAKDKREASPQALAGMAASADLERATFAGGCFWCMEPPFDKAEGVISTTSGYAGGDEPSPTYASVSAGRTHHAEVVQVVFDPAKVSYEELLEIYWRNVDPLAVDRQFCDRGRHYRSAILTDDEAQRAAAMNSKARLDASGRFDRPIVTEIVDLGTFTPAEEYHQDYYTKNPIRYRFYRQGCGRDARLAELWGDEASS